MLAIGLWAAQHGARIRCSLMLVACGSMVLGASLAMWGNVALPVPDAGLATSLLVLGLCLAFAVRLPLSGVVALVGVFAAVHGHAHGAELTLAASLPLYGAGFLAAAVSVQAVGIVLGERVANARVPGLLRVSGLLVAGGGLVTWA